MQLSSSTYSADEIVRRLRLERLPREGGFFRRTAEAGSMVSTPGGPRRAWSTILALFAPGQFSAFHRLESDEVWCFLAGDPLDLVVLESNAGVATRLGPAPDFACEHVVRANTWQGAQVVAGGRWSLVTCVVIPGFHWEDFELGARANLEREFPTAREVIQQLTR